jgi:endonuclease YncB( thermonuclease family)
MVLLAACSTPVSVTSTTPPPVGVVQPTRPDGLVTGVVTWVSDGDTIDVETDQGVLEVRLLGVNTTEKGECFADEPKTFLIDNVKDATVGLEMAGVDQFGRTLGSVWLDEEMINLILVSEGFAIAITPDESDPYGEELLAAEELAYKEGLGLWALDACGNSASIPKVSLDPAASQFNPTGPDDVNLDEEYIVIVNESDREVAMDGWTLRDESSRNRLVFPNGTIVAVGSSLRISSGCSTTPAWCGTTPIWNNGGDMALLLDETGRVVARTRY